MKSGLIQVDVGLMQLSAELDDVHKSCCFMMLIGLTLLMMGLCSGVFGILLPGRGRADAEPITREANPLRFWIFIVVVVAAGVFLLVTGAGGFLLA